MQQLAKKNRRRSKQSGPPHKRWEKNADANWCEGKEVVTIQAECGEIESVEEFCYLGSMASRDCSCDKDIKIRLGKANATFERLSNVWKSKRLKLKVKISEDLRLRNVPMQSILALFRRPMLVR